MKSKGIMSFVYLSIPFFTPANTINPVSTMNIICQNTGLYGLEIKLLNKLFKSISALEWNEKERDLTTYSNVHPATVP